MPTQPSRQTSGDPAGIKGSDVAIVLSQTKDSVEILRHRSHMARARIARFVFPYGDGELRQAGQYVLPVHRLAVAIHQASLAGEGIGDDVEGRQRSRYGALM